MNDSKLLKKKLRAKTEGNNNSLISATIDLASHYFKHNEYMSAIPQYIEAGALYKTMGKLMDYGRVARMIGDAYINLQEFQTALTYFQKYLTIARREDNVIEQQRAYASIGHSHLTKYLTSYENNICHGNKQNELLTYAKQSFNYSLDLCEKITGLNKRDVAEMSVRLYINLGVVAEYLGNFEEAISLMQRSVKECKSHSITDELERAHSLLANLYSKSQNFISALHHYNLAIEVAGCLDDKKALIQSSLLAKTDIFVKLSNFHSAKKSLQKAYKLNVKGNSERDIARDLRVAASLCITENQLTNSDTEDYLTRKLLYEKMGDGATVLKNYPIAIEYYHKMLDAAEKFGDRGKSLSPCYVSLAQTYMDNKEYNCAIQYFQKELDIGDVSIDKPEDTIDTLLHIAQALESSFKPFSEIETVLNKALTLAGGIPKLEHIVLNRLLTALETSDNNQEKVTEVRRKLDCLGYDPSDTESMELVENDETLVQADFDDIDIEELSDVSDDCDTVHRKTTRTSRATLTVRRNDKGETQLHTACISGRLELVRRLLDQGHPVNVRDHCGWLPVHEATNHGHLDVVRLLVERGAAVNDPGGSKCEGMTPLHDAAANGHLPIIEYLLDEGGASSHVINDRGETVADILQHWQKSADLDSIEQSYYETVFSRIVVALEKSGKQLVALEGERDRIALVEEGQNDSRDSSDSSDRSRSNERVVGSLRKTVESFSSSDSENGDCDVIMKSPVKSKSTVGEYKAVMESFRTSESLVKKRNFGDLRVKKRKTIDKKSALLKPEEVGENWLENDVQFVNKKRKLLPLNPLSLSTSLRVKNTVESSKKPQNQFKTTLDCPQRSKSPKRTSTSPKTDKNNYNFNPGDFLPDDFFEPTKKLVTKQSMLTNSGFRRRLSSPDCLTSGNSTVRRSKSKTSHIQPTLTSFVNKSNRNSSLLSLKRRSFNSICDNEDVGEVSNSVDDLVVISDDFVEVKETKTAVKVQMLSVDVRVEKRMFKIPVPMVKIEELTVKWLIDEAAKRYYIKEGLMPVLELETKQGATLDENDTISMLFPISSMQAEELQGKVVSWNVPTLVERYREVCKSTNTSHNDRIINTIQDNSTVISLKRFHLRITSLSPLFKALKRQTNLTHLNLMGNRLGVDGIKLLCTVLPTLPHITTLNLTLTHISHDSVTQLSELLSSDPPVCTRLTTIGFSNNPLGDKALKPLSTISRKLNLEEFSLSDVGFSKELFRQDYDCSGELMMDYATVIDISGNCLGKRDVVQFISGCQGEKIKVLNVAENKIEEEGLVTEIVYFFKQSVNELSLTTLDFSGTAVTDFDIEELLSLNNVPLLQTLVLDNNEGITAISVQKLFEQLPTLPDISLKNCKNLSRNFDNCNWSIYYNNSDMIKCRNVRLMLDFRIQRKQCDILIELWRKCHQSLAKVWTAMHYYIELSIVGENPRF